MRRDVYTPVAESVPFDNSTNGYTSDNVQDAIIETGGIAVLQSRAPLLYWEYNSNAGVYLYLAGQTKSNNVPYIVPKEAYLREIGVTARVTTNPSSAFYTVYSTTAINSITPGVLPTVTNQTLVYEESDFPHAGVPRVTINLVNNGPSLPLTFSENTTTRVVTIQLATNGAGVVTTTRTQLRNAFRNNNTITLIWRITGTGGAVMTPASFSTAGGTVGSAIGSVFLRANSFAISYYDRLINPLSLICVQCTFLDFGSIADTSVQVTLNYA